jgi:hypothetical protein
MWGKLTSNHCGKGRVISKTRTFGESGYLFDQGAAEGAAPTTLATTNSLGKQLLQRSPIMAFPSGCQTLRFALWKAGMVEDDFALGAKLHEVEMGD